MTIRERHREQQVAQWTELVQECRSSGQTVTDGAMNGTSAQRRITDGRKEYCSEVATG